MRLRRSKLYDRLRDLPPVDVADMRSGWLVDLEVQCGRQDMDYALAVWAAAEAAPGGTEQGHAPPV